jgi:SAM-dependent methyltransferase
MTMARALAARSHWFLSVQAGIDLRKTFYFLLALPRYVYDLVRFRSRYKGRFNLLPCLHDRHEDRVTASEYFVQDLLVANMIYKASPERHLDVGSRIDGFVAHVASFRPIEVLDIRPVSTPVPNVAFKQVDVAGTVAGMDDYADSVSCLHALEHFGLGRYGDPVDPGGYEHGIANMARFLRRGGILYLSVPIGIARVEFNAHRVFDPRHIVSLAAEHQLRLSALTVISSDGRSVAAPYDEAGLSALAQLRYSLGVFVFHKSGRL